MAHEHRDAHRGGTVSRLRGLVALSAVGLALLVTGVAALASSRSTTWQEFASRVNFPVYRPTVTLGFKLSLDGPFPCNYGGIQTIGARYNKGSGTHAPVIGFAEAYPQICGNAGESMTVTSADINGVNVAINVYCYSPGPKCAVKDGFSRGFLLYLRQPGPKRTSLQIDSRYVSLDILLRVVRSLAKVNPGRLTLGGGSFRSPTGNLSCHMGDSTVYCQSEQLPHSVYMGLDGRFTVCPGRSCIGKPDSNSPTLAYGREVTVGGFRCGSAQAGITCTAIQSGKGFLIDRVGVRRVG